ncbi:MAG: helix-turn-helix domain-containing protein [Bacteroidota bacterium]|nr:helix-turn-helix domain-containing protein [Bacteroidota bacterium]
MNNLSGQNNYTRALHRISEIMKVNPSEKSEEYKEMDMLVSLVEAYEEVYSPMVPSDPIGYLRYKMQKEGIKQKDLIPALGSKYTVSKVLNNKQQLTIEMIKKLSALLKIPAVRLIGN